MISSICRRTKPTRRDGFVGLGSSAGALMLPRAGFAQDGLEELAAKAKVEGEVIWYTSLVIPQVVRPLADAFEATYPGVKVNFTRQTSADLAQRIITEHRAGRMLADVFDGSSTIFPLLEADAVDSYSPHAATSFAPEFRDAAGFWTALNVYYLVPSYNTGLVSKDEAPKSYADLLDPKWQGRMAWADDPGINGPPGFIAMILGQMGQEAGMDYLRRLAAQKIAKVPAAQRVVLDQVIAGEHAIGLMTFNHHVAISKEAGAPIEWVRAEPAVNTMNYLGLTKGGAHPNAARLLLEFALSEKGQAVLQGANYLPANPKVAAKVPALKPLEGGFKAFSISTESQRKNFADWLRIYEDLFRK